MTEAASADPEQITSLLKAWETGDQAALDRLTPLVYSHLSRMARAYMRKEQSGNTLQATALVHEAYLRLIQVNQVKWQDRAHFFAICANLMRRILVDAARTRAAVRHGGNARRVSSADLKLDQIPDVGPGRDDEIVALHDALNALSEWDSRKARVVELRFFGGLTAEETAEVLKVSPHTVRHDWSLARAWLNRELSR